MIKYTLLSILAALTISPAMAQTQDAAGAEKSIGDAAGNPLALKKKLREEERLRDDKIKDMEKTVAKDTSNKDNRIALADYLEALAGESEKKNDLAGAWRFYQRAAAVLRDPAVAEWEQRAADDTAKAADFRRQQTDKTVALEEARSLARRAREKPPISAPSLNFNAQKESDIFAENRYREQVWKRVQNAWVSSEQRKAVKDLSFYQRPVVVSFDVHSDGEVTNVKITTSSGDRRIDLAALKVVEDLGKIEPLLPGMGQLVRFHTEFGK